VLPSGELCKITLLVGQRRGVTWTQLNALDAFGKAHNCRVPISPSHFEFTALSQPHLQGAVPASLTLRSAARLKVLPSNRVPNSKHQLRFTWAAQVPIRERSGGSACLTANDVGARQ
jgi:hypothetical protein